MSHKRIVFSGSNGIEIVGHIAGPNTGATVLLAHGGGQTKRAWAKTLEQLATAGYRAVAVDLRGHGESGKPHDAAAYPADALTDDNLALVEQMGLTDYDLGGYSLGARTTVRMLARGATPRRVILAGMGLRGLSGGALANSAAAEALTSILIYMNKTYKADGAGIRFTNLAEAPAIP
jgi:pimeloyl-ACP methyl ester carboxylesterase